MDRKVTALILAAGSGSRMGEGVKKQYRLIRGEPLLVHTLRAFMRMPCVTDILITAPKGEEDECLELAAQAAKGIKEAGIWAGPGRPVHVAAGGRRRCDSVLNGLKVISENTEGQAKDHIVMIHDGARPFADAAMADRLTADVEKYGSAIAAVPVKDTIRIADDDGFGIATPDRQTLWSMQTPQVFMLETILEAYSAVIPAADEAGRYTDREGNTVTVTDDAFVYMTHTGKPVKLTEGSYENIKITTPEDMLLAEQILKEREGSGES